jgi:hypothetical protein
VQIQARSRWDLAYLYIHIVHVAVHNLVFPTYISNSLQAGGETNRERE